jgi:hypothetical protein
MLQTIPLKIPSFHHLGIFPSLLVLSMVVTIIKQVVEKLKN